MGTVIFLCGFIASMLIMFSTGKRLGKTEGYAEGLVEGRNQVFRGIRLKNIPEKETEEKDEPSLV